MSATFDKIVAGGYFVGFGGLEPSQEECKAFTAQHLATILHVRQREKFFKEVRVCLCGYGPADEDEPMEDNNFSQYQFYLPFTNDLIMFHDKFDFLVKCVANGVCKVELGFEDRYMQAILDVLTFRDTTVPAEPQYVLDLRTLSTPRTVGELPRTFEENQLLVESYVMKRNAYSEKIRAELEQLEAEQLAAEKGRGEHPSVMGWSNPGTPTSSGRGACSCDDASTARLKTAISLAKEEAALTETVEASSAVAAGGAPAEATDVGDNATTAPLQPANPDSGATSQTPLLHMLLRLQEAQMQMQQEAELSEEMKSS